MIVQQPLILQPQLRDLLPALTQEEYEYLKASIADDGIEMPLIVDQEENIVDGFARQRACDELGIYCPREVRHFETEQQKCELRIRVNCRRRQLSQKQKAAVIETYLRCDPLIADKHLADIIGVSQNTVAKVRERLVATFQIEKFERLRGRDGKERPRKYKRIIANTAKEAEAAVTAISALPDHCDGKIIDATTAKRRAARHSNKQRREQRVVKQLENDDIRLFYCPFQELEVAAGIEPETVNLVYTDIPYDQSFLAQVSDLGSFAARVLVDGGILAVLCGQYWVHKVLEELGKHLTYRWINASVWNGDATPVHIGGWKEPHARVLSRWKPIIVFSKGGLLLSSPNEPEPCERLS